MVSLTIPKIFFNIWFWLALMAIVIGIHFFWGKTPTHPPKESKFVSKHKKTINKIMDICIICFVLVYCSALMFSPTIAIFDALHESQPIQATDIRFAFAFWLISIIPCSGVSSLLVGLLSIFHSNLTKVKRVLLLIISLLPLAFTVILLLIEYQENPWPIIKLGLIYSFNCWIINGPAIIIGKHFLPVSWSILRVLRLVSGDYPE